jgi:hypothetical protein
MLMQLVNVYGCLTIDAACAVSGKSPKAAVKELGRYADLGWLVKTTYIHPRCYWYPKGRPLGAQRLVLASSVLHRCVLAEPRIWTPEVREGPATLITCSAEREALFVDYGATPRHVARKLAAWCESRDISQLTALGVVVATTAKARAINGAAQELPLPIRYTISDDLLRLTCAKVRR